MINNPVAGVFNIAGLQRDDAAATFESDEAAQEFATTALYHHAELVRQLTQLVECIPAGLTGDAYAGEIENAQALLYNISVGVRQYKVRVARVIEYDVVVMASTENEAFSRAPDVFEEGTSVQVSEIHTKPLRIV